MTLAEGSTKRRPVGIGLLTVSAEPSEVLVAYGLGSCIGVAAFDPEAKVGGLAHVLLPQSSGRTPPTRDEPARFADAGVDLLLQEMEAQRAKRARIEVKLAGGAAVLGRENAQRFKIGERNAEAVREKLHEHGLRPTGEEIGGNKGRTLELHILSGKTIVRTAASAGREL